jgi:hypothetical protein
MGVFQKTFGFVEEKPAISAGRAKPFFGNAGFFIEKDVVLP